MKYTQIIYAGTFNPYILHDENKAYKFYLLGIKAGIFGVLGDIFSCVGSNLMPLYSTW